MPIETVETNAWRHLDVAREAIDLERTRRIQALAPGESISFIDAPPPAPLRQARSAGASPGEAQSPGAQALQAGRAQQAAEAVQAHPGALTGVLNLSPIGSDDSSGASASGAAALLSATESAAADSNAANANASGDDLANRWYWFQVDSASHQARVSFLDDWRSRWKLGNTLAIDMNGVLEYTAEWDKAHIGASEPHIEDYFSPEELALLFSDSSLSGKDASTGTSTDGSTNTEVVQDGNADHVESAGQNTQEDGNRIDEGSFYGSDSRGWEAAWDARMRSYEEQFSSLNTFRGSVSQGYLDYANEMSLLFLQQPSWDDFAQEMGLEDEFPLSDPSMDDASADDGFDLNFDGLIDQAAGTSETSTSTVGIDTTDTQDTSAQVGITEREQQGIDQSDDIQHQRLEEQAEANGTSGRLPDGRFQTADGRIVTNGSHVVTHPAQGSASSSAYPGQYVHVDALPGVLPQGELTPAPDLPALPAVLTPTLLDGRPGTGVPYRDQAGQIFYETFDAEGKAVGLRSVPAAAATLPLADVASAAAPLVLTGLTAEASYGPWPFRVAAVATLAGATWLMARGTDDLLNREALDPERVSNDQLPPVNVPVSPGPGGTPGYVTDSRDTSTPALQPPDLLPPLTTTLPTTERSWRDLIVEAGGSWNTSNESTDANVVQQSTSTSCGPACAQMLLGDRGIAIDQSAIGDSLTSAQGLAASLNSVDSGWIGAGVDPSSLAALTRTGSWSAMMWEPGARAGHWVVVDGISPDGLVNIRDPFDATRYEVTQSEFLKYWSGYSVFKP
jgi:hypothetical protein